MEPGNIWKPKRGAKGVFAGALLAVLAGCASESGPDTARVEIDGRSVVVEKEGTGYRAYGATARDRAMLDARYYARNVIAIRQVTGCKLDARRIRHDKDGPNTVAAVICDA
jgi:hypothetical protein